MKDSETIYIKTKAYHNNLCCTISQKYRFSTSSGHYCWVITNISDDIVDAGRTTGGAPSGMVDMDTALECLRIYIRNNK